MRATLSGTRGSVGRAGPETMGYGGDTSCVLVEGDDGDVIILDAGSGLVRLNSMLDPLPPRIDIFLTHLHMDHIQGLGFFRALRIPEIEVGIWGPVSSTMHLRDRLGRYLSPPLFPVRLRDLPNVSLHDVGPGTFDIGSFSIGVDLIIHPGPTVGYRLTENGRSLAYLPDHEPALGSSSFPKPPEWTSGHDLCRDVNVLIHDFQYTPEEYRDRQGWGHSSIPQTLAFAEQVEAGRLVTFHHDPDHDDATLNLLHIEAAEKSAVDLIPGRAGLSFEI